MSATANVQRVAFRRHVSEQDLTMYAAILGRAPTFQSDEPPLKLRPAQPRWSSRNWSPALLNLSIRLRELCEQGIAARVRRPEVADWLRHVSDEAFRRLDEAQARLAAARRSVPRTGALSAAAISSTAPPMRYRAVA